MTTVDDLWYLGDVARQSAEQTYHSVADRHEDFLECTRHRSVSRPRFRTVADRIRDNGLPYGATRSRTANRANSCSSATTTWTCGSSPAGKWTATNRSGRPRVAN